MAAAKAAAAAAAGVGGANGNGNGGGGDGGNGAIIGGPAGGGSRWRDRGVVEGIWAAIEEGMRARGFWARR